MLKTVTIILPSFLRRVLKAYALKAQLRALGCDLARIGRSRNWQITATPETIIEAINLIELSNEESWVWVSKKLKQDNQHLSLQHILAIAKKNKGITVNELMAKTNCTIAEARQAIDELEWQDDEC